MSSDREWMYTTRVIRGGYFNPIFAEHVTSFLDFAFTNLTDVGSQTIEGVEVLLIRCPCAKCKNQKYKSREAVEQDLITKGFMPDYWVWYAHGETFPKQDVGQCSNPMPSHDLSHHTDYISTEDNDDDLGDYTGYDQMVMESMHQNHHPYYHQQRQEPNQTAEAFYTMLGQADEPLWAGSEKASTLSTTTRLLNWKSDCNVSDSTFDRMLPIFKDSLPNDEKLPRNFYETKKMLKPLEMPSQRIHVCKNHCMLYYGQFSDLDKCLVCHENRYKERGNKVPNLVMTYMPIGPRLQRLFYSKKTAQHLTWHAVHHRQLGKMIHPSEGRAWEHFDSVFPDFAQETRNIRLGLCTDGFSPNSSKGAPYSCWPVFITVYNLPPWLALKERYIQIPLIIPGPKNPTHNLDVFLQPLIEELKLLFTDGIETYDAYRMNNFQMKVALLWTISDFPAYAMLSGWGTHGKLACPYCSNKSGSFQLEFGVKACWFDCHRQHLPAKHSFRKDKINFWKNRRITSVTPIPQPTGEEIWQTVQHFPTVYQGTPYTPTSKRPNGYGNTHHWVKRSIFWELPYWRKLLIRHNLDVMHIEKNVFDNLFHMIMDTNRSKDNIKARQDLELICDRPLLNPIHGNNGKMTKNRGNYTLQKKDVKKVCEWLKKIKFPDGYASNIGNCVKIQDNSFHPFKSHDCHVFMQRLLPIAIRGFVSKDVYEAVTELCMFFRVLCSKTLHLDDLFRMKDTIVQTICKLERILPPSFFDSMEHLVIHLADEALLGGPVQYRWMYQYERKLGLIKRRIRNKARVEGSIVREHLMNELATYCSLYFDPNIETRHNREPRNFAPQHKSSLSGGSELSVFCLQSRRLYENGGKRRILTHEEHNKAHTYVLLNCAEVTPYVIEFDEVAPQMYPDDPVACLRDKYFAQWFENRVMMGSFDGSCKHLEVLARKPSLYAQSHKGYFVNGYKFHTQEHGKGCVTNNYGVCVRGEMYNAEESDYYGLLEEILELEYFGSGRSIVVLFKCIWFDNNRGVIVNKNKLVDVKPKSRLQTNDPFILASQAEQVFYTPYPAGKSDLKDLWAVVKTKPRGVYEVTCPESEDADDGNTDTNGLLQFDERFEPPDEVTSSERLCLVTNTNAVEIITDEEDDEEIEEELEEEEFVDEEDTDSEEDEMVYYDDSSDDHDC
ncbi:hypothetical protein SSX86_030202 [Deinandra increscens subsp. villosa]|uniref:Transposase n=1 Tax=Deinandra increscens subsp. villosa TaxID=3103831 RepID=A0AAP0CCB2_9ASTR